MAIEFVRDVIGQVIASVEKLQNLKPRLSDEQIAVVQEFVTAQYWEGYKLGYTSAKQGDPNIAELVTSTCHEERERAGEAVKRTLPKEVRQSRERTDPNTLLQDVKRITPGPETYLNRGEKK
jgi:hypothetical protein